MRLKILENPVKTAFIVFLLTSLLIVLITGLKVNIKEGFAWGYYDQDFITNVLVETHGMLLDILIIGVFLLWLDKRREKNIEIEAYKNEIDDFRNWKDDEAKHRIIGNIKRLLRLNQHKLDLNSCYLGKSEINKSMITPSENKNLYKNIGKLNFYIDFSYSIFNHSILNKSILQDIIFDFGKFYETQFVNSIIINCSFKEAILINSNFRKSLLFNLDFSNCTFDSTTNFEKSIFYRLDFSKTELGQCRLSGVLYDDNTKFPKDLADEKTRKKRGMIYKKNLLELIENNSKYKEYKKINWAFD